MRFWLLCCLTFNCRPEIKRQWHIFWACEKQERSNWRSAKCVQTLSKMKLTLTSTCSYRNINLCPLTLQTSDVNMILNMHADTQLGLSPWGATHTAAREVKDTGGEGGASEKAGARGEEQQERPGRMLLNRRWCGGGGRPGPQRAPVRQTALPWPASCICWTKISMKSEKADHLTRRVPCTITAHKQQEGLMLVKAQQQRGQCVFSRLSCCLIECITGLRLQK